jgi:hypothetical protein
LPHGFHAVPHRGLSRFESKFAGKEYESMVLEDSRVEDHVKDLGAKVAEALLLGDSSSLAELLGEGFVLRMPDGERILRDELLDMLANRQMRYDALSVEFGGVQVYDGQVAFLSGYCNCVKYLRGQHIAGRFPFTALYVCRRGIWQIVAIHHIDVVEGAGAGKPQ